MAFEIFLQTLVHFALLLQVDEIDQEVYVFSLLIENSTRWVENTVSVKLEIFQMDLHPKH